MTPNQYLKAVLDEQTFSNDAPEMDDLRKRRDAVKSLLETEFSDSKPSIHWAGSKAKGTMIKASYDGDMTCYFDRETDDDAGDTLQEIYGDVESALTDYYSVERKTSALRIRDKAGWDSDLHIDVVPGRYTDDDHDDVFLYQADNEKSRLKTNLQTHIDHIRTSGVRAAIRLLKYWRTLNGIVSAKTFVLELLVVKLLDGKENAALETQLTHVFAEFSDNSANLAIEDPANSNNDLKPALDMCRGMLATVASNTLWQVENNGWEAVFGALESDTEEKSQALKSATVVTVSRTRPWSSLALASTIWHRQYPDLIEAIQSDLRQRQPNLHLHIRSNGRSEIRGTFVVWSDDRKELDRYQVEIRLLGRYPKKLPIVKEVGGRIPRNPDRHVNKDGSVCVLMPEDRGRCFPEGAPFSVYLDGPLRDFFLSQTWYEREGKWPFDQWSHGALGILEYYRYLIGVTDGHTVLRYVRVLSYPKLKRHLLCPCGSGRRLRVCCYDQVTRLRSTTDPVFAKRSLRTLEAVKRVARTG